MPIVSVRYDFWRFSQTLDDLGSKQLPYATALAINTTARTAQGDLTRALPAIFARKGVPTPFTLRAIGMTGARKSNLRAQVFVKRAQVKYLAIEETGGAVTPAPGAPILTPVNAALNRYGNIPRGRIAKLAATPGYFLGTVRGVYGLWQRAGEGGKGNGGRHGLKLIAAMREHASYRPRFGFHDHIGASVRTNFLPALSAGMARAMATAIKR